MTDMEIRINAMAAEAANSVATLNLRCMQLASDLASSQAVNKAQAAKIEELERPAQPEVDTTDA